MTTRSSINVNASQHRPWQQRPLFCAGFGASAEFRFGQNRFLPDGIIASSFLRLGCQKVKALSSPNDLRKRFKNAGTKTLSATHIVLLLGSRIPVLNPR